MKNLLLALLLLTGVSLSAQTITWDGGGSNNFWNNPLNWSTDQVPTADDWVEIDASGADITVVVNSNDAVAGKSI